MVKTYSPPLPIRKKGERPEKCDGPELGAIFLEICQIFEQSPEIVSSKSRKREVVNYRRIFFYVANVLTDASCKAISQFMGQRDHSTYLFNSQAAADHFTSRANDFMDDWSIYADQSEIWKKYYPIKLTANSKKLNSAK